MDFDTSIFALAWSFITSLSLTEFVSIFWFFLIFEVPRYTLTFTLLFLAAFNHRIGAYFGRKKSKNNSALTQDKQQMNQTTPLVSVIVAGHNEGNAIEKCLRSLQQQTLKNFEVIIVSDGSTDNMVSKCRDMVKQGLATKFLFTDLRCGKSAAMNLAHRYCKGEIVINIDCDCSFEPDALEKVIQPLLDDPAVGGSSGNIMPRNTYVNLVTRMQHMEYLMSISVGKRILALFDQVTCMSGAFSAFRQQAYADIGGTDVGGGEDFDYTMRLRNNGWKIAFVPGAMCYTDVPEKLWTLVRQRLRWERDTIRVRYRKHAYLLNPFSKNFLSAETFHQFEALLINTLATVLFPIYLIITYAIWGNIALMIWFGVQITLMCVSAFTYLTVVFVSGDWRDLRHLPYIPLFDLFNSYFMRGVRFWAYVEEWFWDASRHDGYAPTRARYAKKW